MNDFEYYQCFVDNIFGKGNIVVKQSKIGNKITGVFKYIDNFDTFKNGLKNRLIRLKERYEGTKYYKELCNKVALLSDNKNWEGAYAELVAFDVLNLSNFLINPIQMESNEDKSTALAFEAGKNESNEDGYIDEYSIYFDVKILSDVVGIFLQRVIDAAKKIVPHKHCIIVPEYDLDDSIEKYENVFNDLKIELETELAKETSYIKSTIINGLHYRVSWEGGVICREAEYGPYHNAMTMKDTLIKRYYYKFKKQAPFFLVMVNFPWYNQLHTDSFGFNKVFYRALARRTFVGYKHDNTAMSTLIAGFNSSMSVYDVSKLLTGIIFIDDKSITMEGYGCYVYLNPNAKNKSPRCYDYLQQILNLANGNAFDFDDFEYDNY